MEELKQQLIDLCDEALLDPEISADDKAKIAKARAQIIILL